MFLHRLFFIFFILKCSILMAQNDKLSPHLNRLQYRHDFSNTRFIVAVSDIDSFNFFIKKNMPDARVEYTYDASKTLIFNLKRNNYFNQLKQSPLVKFIDLADRQVQEELKVPGHNLATNRITTAQNNYPQLRGAFATISIKENRFDSSDIDLINRYTRNPQSANDITTHANLMANLVAGAGNSSYQGRGVAPGAQLVSHDFRVLLPESDAEYSSKNITIQNHSYGVGIESYYGADATAYDKSVEVNPSLLHVFSAGNRGFLAGTEGVYAGLTNYANITGSFKMSKNTLSIGAIDSFGQVVSISSRGPAHDGRLKPELVAYASDGSSEAAALVSGAAAVLQDFYVKKYNQRPSAALVKAILINSADDVGEKGIDFQSGYGSLNLLKAVENLQNARFFNGKLNKNEVFTQNISVPSNVKELKLTLVWSDTPSVANARKALVNDLDLQLKNAQTNEIWLPWVLNTTPNSDSLKQLPRRNRDTLNNVEQITIDNPTSGVYTISVSGRGIKTLGQDFAISFDFTYKNTFNFTFPTKNDVVVSGSSQVARWDNTFDKNKATLLFKPVNKTEWTILTDTLNPTKGWQRWEAPDSFFLAQLRVSIDNQFFTSDTFVVSNLLRLNVAFDCTDSVGVYWPKVAPTEGYQIFVLNDKYLQFLKTVNDTFAVLKKRDLASPYLAVAPIAANSNRVGMLSLAANYGTQGTACFIKSFLAQLTNDETVDITLILGTLYSIKKVYFEKSQGDYSSVLKEFSNPTMLNFSFTDVNLVPGFNSYQVRIELANGQTVRSEWVNIFYFKNKKYYFNPSVVIDNQTLTLFSNEPEPVVLKMYNMLGALVFEKEITVSPQSFNLPNLSSGLYVAVFEKKGKIDYQRKIFISN